MTTWHKDKQTNRPKQTRGGDAACGLVMGINETGKGLREEA